MKSAAKWMISVSRFILQYVRLNPKTDISRISECLFGVWGMVEPDVIFSVLSDSEYSTAKGNEVIEGMSNGSVQNICRSLVTAAASTSVYTKSPSVLHVYLFFVCFWSGCLCIMCMFGI